MKKKSEAKTEEQEEDEAYIEFQDNFADITRDSYDMERIRFSEVEHAT